LKSFFDSEIAYIHLLYLILLYPPDQMNYRLMLILAAVIAVAAVGTTTMMTTTVQAAKPDGNPYGDLVKGEAQEGERGFGGDIQDFCDQGECGENDQHLGDFRASDEADKSLGKSGNNIDENAGKSNN
jgi:hypothetical protein